MLNVIVPLDFSQTSFNAVCYAANMYRDRSDIRMILYHFYSKGEDVATAREFLKNQQQSISSLVKNVEIELESGDNFIDSLASFAHVHEAYMIVMGLTGKSPKQQRFSGSNTLKLTEKEVCPVLIIPEDAEYKGISNALITSELKSVEETPCLLTVKRVLKHFEPTPSLHILNVDAEHYISLTDHFKSERDKMEDLLIEFKPEFYFMRFFDFHDSVDEFVKDQHIDLIIIAPKYHNFFERLFKTLHTRKLIYQSKIPVLAVHD